MANHLLPAGFALLLWWFATGAILFLDGLPRRTFRWTVAGAGLTLAAALAGLAATRDATGTAGAYVAFTCAVLVWGFSEITFLTGLVTGPRTAPSPPGASLATRALHATCAILYHEIAIVLSAAAVYALVGDGANQVGLWTFLVLWAMRVSAKLNVFLGVPNPAAEFLPDHLRYLEAWFTRAPMNALFPVSVSAATIVLALIAAAAAAPGASPAEAAGLTLVGALLALAIVEHWFLVLPFPSVTLWRWGLASRAESRVPSSRPAGAPDRPAYTMPWRRP